MMDLGDHNLEKTFQPELCIIERVRVVYIHKRDNLVSVIGSSREADVD